MAEAARPGGPVVVFVPPGLESAEVSAWRESILDELLHAGVVDPSGRGHWAAILDEVAREKVPEQATGTMLVSVAERPPFYLWVTMAQPSGDPTGLGEAILDSQLPGVDRAESSASTSGSVVHGHRIGRRRLRDGTERLWQLTVTVSTISVPGIGEVDACLWFGSDQLEIVEELLPVVAGLIRDPDLAAYLAA